MGVHCYAAPFDRDVNDPQPELAALMRDADWTIFLARLGDQIRFRTRDAKRNQIINYALDRDMLASPYGTIKYWAFVELSGLINDALQRAREIQVTCPAGTDFTGRAADRSTRLTNTMRRRFPMSVFAPVPTVNFSGRIAQKGFLAGTGSHYCTPSSCEIKKTLFVDFEGTQITGFDGSIKDVITATEHFERVAKRYGLDPYYVHSWHAGIHPGCAYKATAGQNLERWSGSAFGNPRLLHFHTCGENPPGEISLNVLVPTIRVDGIALWENGVLMPERLVGGRLLLASYPEMEAAFLNPARQVGQAACGQLSFV
ncbi:hypothetical protein [Yoonia sediminilitoris]|uniref:hypothetical protein n=1 Tax=Yoonia sediminilitoris TaxID=1286148 RepID=UPI000D3624DE|nr:hypothetical protein [Yoonia sediminilitoris]